VPWPVFLVALDALLGHEALEQLSRTEAHLVGARAEDPSSALANLRQRARLAE
jgi:hypothetical protein